MKLFSIEAVSDIGDQIEYRPPTDSGNGTIDGLANPKALAPSELAVITIELLSVLFFPSQLRQERVSSVASDFEAKIYKFFWPSKGLTTELNSSLSGPDTKK
jgi:hypothetical protein